MIYCSANKVTSVLLTMVEIANYATVSEEFVEKVRAGLAKDKK
ncbi:hypothetical protein ACFOET_05800 [Parapedobacter deserti]|uniref:Uncharacterized protein n=1 Tax=Parapedobacter deserti TaxID=1912957 RepID=A0ABV7JGF7_9SPHI